MNFRSIQLEVIDVFRQFEAPIGKYTFRLDFIISVESRLIGIECDGKDFHDANRDRWRDARIIEAGFATVIYRLRGRDICCHIYDTLDLLRSKEPVLFSERGHTNIGLLATRDIARRHEVLRTTSGLPCVVRWYESSDDEENEYRAILPTVISWTESAVASLGSHL